MTTAADGARTADRLTSRYLPSLVGLRFLAAMSVVLLHARGVLSPGALATLTEPIEAAGRLGVSFFFVLSGFVLTWSARPDTTLRTYFRRRFSRLWPAYAFALLLGALLAHEWSDAPSGWRIVPDLALVQAWIPSSTTFYSVNGVSWSLSCEAAFYVAFPFLLRGVRKLSSGGDRVMLVVASAGIVVVHAATYLGASGSQADTLSPHAQWLAYIFPPTRFLEFLVGVLVARQIRKGVRVRVPVGTALSLFLVVVAVVALHPDELGWEGIAFAPSALLIAAVASREADGGSTFLARPRLMWLGATSYSLYLVHQLVVRVLVHYYGVRAGGIGLILFLLSIVLGIVLGIVVHVIVEAPMERLLRRTRAPRVAPLPPMVTEGG